MTSYAENVCNLCAEQKYGDVWYIVIIQTDAFLRQMRRPNALLQDYIVDETIRNNEMNKHKCRDYFIAYCSGFQLEFRGTLGFR